MRPIIYPYNMASGSARKLAEALPNSLRVYPDRNYRPYRNHLIINWGNPRLPNWPYPAELPWLNKCSSVEVAGNKLFAFEELRTFGVAIPMFTEDNHEAHRWECPVMVRSLLRANSGRGASYVAEDDREQLIGSLAGAPLYVEYIKKRDEYRVHVFKGEVIDTQEKRVRDGSEDNHFQIRSHDNGWVFCRENVPTCQVRDNLAIAAVNALGLDFGAVDIIYNSYRDEYFVLEVNCAPGLEGQTLTNYVDAIRGVL